MVRNFTWRMSEKEWEALKATVHTRDTKKVLDSVLGQVFIGGICCDITHTCDTDDWYAFTSVFFKKENSEYGELDDGTRYELFNDSPCLPLKCRSFEAFKKNFEKKLMDFINQFDELRDLLDVEVAW